MTNSPPDITRNQPATLALIGSVLFENTLIHSVSDVQPEYIGGTEGRVWEAMLALADRGVPINSFSVIDELPSPLRDTGRKILTDAVNRTPVVGRIEQYADAVLEAHERRKAIQYAEELARAAHNENEDIAMAKADLAGKLLRSYQRTDEYDADALYAMDLEQVEDWAANPVAPPEVRGISTGFRDLDDLLDGMWPGYWTVAGRTSMGKTAFAVQLSTNVSRETPVYYVGLEHRPVVYWRRMVGGMAEIPYKAVKRGLAQDQLRRWKRAGDQLRSRRLALYNGSRRLPMVLAAINKAYHRWGELGLVVVDNLGHVRTDDERKVEELDTVTLAFLEMSQRLNCTILALHQINRGVEGRENKRPMLSDLRDSGHIEDNSDVVGLLYRDDYYNDETESPNILDLMVAKNREDGATGIVNLYFNKRVGRISDVYTGRY
jgi:replicative DNA helicase